MRRSLPIVGRCESLARMLRPLLVPLLFLILNFCKPPGAASSPGIDGVWTEALLSAYPPTRGAYSLLYDSNRNRALIVGGFNSTQDFGDVWALDLNNPQAWTLVPVIGEISVPRGEMGAVYDPVRDRVWIWGGRNRSGAVFGEGAFLQFSGVPGEPAVWQTFNANQEPVTGNRPTPRAGQGTVCDPAGHRMIFCGGGYGHLFGTGGTWWLSLDEPPTNWV